MTLGLAGYGEAFFDDFRVELVEADEASGGQTSPGAGKPVGPSTSLSRSLAPPTATSPSGSRTRRQ